MPNKKRKKKLPLYYDKLIPEQKRYIRKKIRELGSLEAVQEHYRVTNKDAAGVVRSVSDTLDTVSRFAHREAKILYKKAN
jgi:hypothetical protein